MSDSIPTSEVPQTPVQQQAQLSEQQQAQQQAAAQQHVQALLAADSVLSEFVAYQAAEHRNREAELQSQLAQATQAAQAPPAPPAPAPAPAPTTFDANVLAQALANSLNPLFSRIPSTHNEKELSIKLSVPETFDGNTASKLRPFLGSLKLHFETQPKVFNSEIKKVNFAISYLRGTPLQEVLPEINKPIEQRAAWLATFDALVIHLVKNYGRVDERTAALQQLNKLEQKSSAAKYWVEFNSISHLTGWDDVALKDKFYKGLKTEVKDGMVFHPAPLNLAALKDLAILLDNRLFERKQEKSDGNGIGNIKSKDNNRSSNNFNNNFNKRKDNSSQDTVKYVSPPTDPNNTSSTYPKPMDLDALKVRYKPLTQEQKDQRRKLGLCLYCGGKHTLEECTKRPAKAGATKSNYSAPAKTAAITFAIEGPSGSPKA